MNWYLHVLSNYAVFGGRARRSEYWYFALFYFIIAVVLYFIGAMIKTALLYDLYVLATIIPSIAVTVRRLHDTGRSGWWWLILLVPVIGWIVMLVFCLQEGQHGANQYGADPKAVGAAVPA